MNWSDYRKPDIKGRNLPNDGIKRYDNFYVELVIDGESKHKTGTAKGNAASWMECFHLWVYLSTCTSHGITNSSGSNAFTSSMLECRLYVKHSIRKDKFIGGTKDGIESLLAKGAGGGLYILFSCWTPFTNNHIPLAITRELCKFDSRGNQRKTQIVIEFTIAATSKASDSTGLNVEEAVAQGKDALLHMAPAPSLFGPIQGAVDPSVAVATNISSLLTTWDPLLQKVTLFTKLVDRIAQVSVRADDLFAESDHEAIEYPGSPIR
jgi:hypothetical protein